MRNRNNDIKPVKLKIFRDISKARLQVGSNSEQRFFKIKHTPTLPTIYEESESNNNRFKLAWNSFCKSSNTMQSRVDKRQKTLFRKHVQRMASIPEENSELVISNTRK